MAEDGNKALELAAFDRKVDRLRHKLSRRVIASRLKATAYAVKAAILRLELRDKLALMPHQGLCNEVIPGGVIHRCSCGWISRPWFSGMLASADGERHREDMKTFGEGAKDGSRRRA